MLGDYWHPDRGERTEIGWLVHRAKDRADESAAKELAERFASVASDLGETADGSGRLVVAVPSKPVLAGEDDRPHLAAHLAASLAAAGAGEYRPSLVAKTNDTQRLRHVDPSAPGRRGCLSRLQGERVGGWTPHRGGRRCGADRHDGESGGGLPARRGSGLGDSSRGRPHQTPLTAASKTAGAVARTSVDDGRRAARTGSAPRLVAGTLRFPAPVPERTKGTACKAV